MHECWPRITGISDSSIKGSILRHERQRANRELSVASQIIRLAPWVQRACSWQQWRCPPLGHSTQIRRNHPVHHGAHNALRDLEEPSTNDLDQIRTLLSPAGRTGRWPRLSNWYSTLEVLNALGWKTWMIAVPISVALGTVR